MATNDQSLQTQPFHRDWSSLQDLSIWEVMLKLQVKERLSKCPMWLLKVKKRQRKALMLWRDSTQVWTISVARCLTQRPNRVWTITELTHLLSLRPPLPPWTTRLCKIRSLKCVRLLQTWHKQWSKSPRMPMLISNNETSPKAPLSGRTHSIGPQ